jgi:hypothetical protein
MLRLKSRQFLRNTKQALNDVNLFAILHCLEVRAG